MRNDNVANVETFCIRSPGHSITVDTFSEKELGSARENYRFGVIQARLYAGIAALSRILYDFGWCASVRGKCQGKRERRRSLSCFSVVAIAVINLDRSVGDTHLS
jgi:hypothetical protein